MAAGDVGTEELAEASSRPADPPDREIQDPSDTANGHAPDPRTCQEHGEIHREERPWLPKQIKGDLAPHPYCPECGEVKAIGGRKGLDQGGLVNLVARLEKDLERDGHVVTDVQKRLLMKRIRDEELDDAYGFTRSRQLELVAEMASKILGLPTTVVASYLRLD